MEKVFPGTQFLMHFFAAKLFCFLHTFAVKTPLMPFWEHPGPTAAPAVLASEVARRAVLSTTLAELYPEPTSLIFEAGCGHGHFLSAYAAAHPKTYCLGVDLVTQRIERANRKQTRLALQNLAFLKADVVETLASLPPYVQLAGIFVLFPDPWPKTRHHHRRLLQNNLLDALTARAASDAWLAVRTDDSGFYEWSKSQINNNLSWKISSNFPWPFEHTSYFQEIKGPHQSLVAIKC